MQSKKDIDILNCFLKRAIYRCVLKKSNILKNQFLFGKNVTKIN